MLDRNCNNPKGETTHGPSDPKLIRFPQDEEFPEGIDPQIFQDIKTSPERLADVVIMVGIQSEQRLCNNEQEIRLALAQTLARVDDGSFVITIFTRLSTVFARVSEAFCHELVKNPNFVVATSNKYERS